MTPRTGRSWLPLRADLAWALATPLVALVAAVLPVLGERDFYFRDDTELGAFPIWFRLGEKIRAGEWPLLEPSLWTGGNIVAEGQWGLFSPITLTIGFLSSFSGSAVTFSTAVKLFFLAVAAVGTYLLARTYSVRPPLAFAAGVAVPVNGFTLYMDAPSWVTGLMTWALLPFAWAALRRSTMRRASPVAFLVLAYLIVTVGYFHGFLALGVVVIAVGVDRLLLRDWRGVRVVVLGGVFCLLLAVTVYLPAVLTADVSFRNSDTVANTGFLNAGLSALAGGMSPTGMSRVSGWWGPFTVAPITYIAWFLPVLAMLSWTRLRPQLRELRDLAIVGTTAVLVVIGPSDLGPLRFPVRVMPYVALVVVVAVVVLLDRSLPARPSRAALGAACAWLLLACFLAYAQRPSQFGLITAGTVLALLAGTGALWLLLRRAPRLGTPRLTAVVALLLAAGTVVGTASQASLYPDSPLPHFEMPGQLADYRTQLPEAVNDVVVVGAPSAVFEEQTPTRFDDEFRPPRQPRGAEYWDEALLGNTWLLNEASVQNTYSVVQFAEYSRLLCMNHRGETCPGLLQRLFRVQPNVYEPLVDVLSIDTVLILKDELPEQEWRTPPAGWSVGRDRLRTISWVRDEPVGPAGGVVWTSAGMAVTELERTNRTVRLRLDEKGPDDAHLVLSRLAWPGYSVEGGELEEVPLNGYLLAVDLAEAQEGDVVTVSFSPPGWTAGLVSLGLALALGVVWSLLHVLGAVRARRGRSRSEEAAAPAEDGAPALVGRS